MNTLNLSIPTLKSLFIEMYRGDILLASGTAFLAANNQQSHCTLITNRHNVTGRDNISGKCLNKMGATPDTIVIHFHKAGRLGEWTKIHLPLYRDDGSPWWIEHPKLGEIADIAALNLSWGSDVDRIPYYMEMELDRNNVYVGPAEPISVIGYPFGLSSFGKFPIWTTGFLAQELDLIDPELPCFLIDCRTRQGQSGSPVIAYRTGSYRTKKSGGPISATLSAASSWEFLGIYSGRVNAESDLGRVWHAAAVKELLDASEACLKNDNKKSDREADSPLNTPPAPDR